MKPKPSVFWAYVCDREGCTVPADEHGKHDGPCSNAAQLEDKHQLGTGGGGAGR